MSIFLTFYGVLLLLILNMGYWWLVWIILEFMTWSLLALNKTLEASMKFLLWQSMSSLFMLITILVSKSAIGAVLLLFYKMSLPPFHLWFWSCIKKLSWTLVVIFNFSHKLPTVILLSNLYFPLFYLYLMGGVIFIFFWSFSTLKVFIWTMSLLEVVWMLVATKSLNCMLNYFILNTIFMMMLLVNQNKNYSLLLLVVVGLPPFSLFQVKILILGMSLSCKMIILLLINFVTSLFYWFYIFLLSSSSLLFNFKASQQSLILYLVIHGFWVFFF